MFVHIFEISSWFFFFNNLISQISVSLDTNAFAFVNGLYFLCGSHALFTESVSTDFSKIFFFKTGSHSTVLTFKNYFVIVFSVFSFQFSTINDIQTDPKLVLKYNNTPRKLHTKCIDYFKKKIIEFNISFSVYLIIQILSL